MLLGGGTAGGCDGNESSACALLSGSGSVSFSSFCFPSPFSASLLSVESA